MVFSEEEQAQNGLLFVVLSVIYMNNEVIKQEALFNFLQKLKLWEEDIGKRDRFSVTGCF